MQVGAAAVAANISAGSRFPSGKRRREAHGGNPALAWRRFRDWNIIKQAGEDAILGSEIGRMFAHGILTGREASAARLYAEITARYDQYHAPAHRTARSPAYEYSTGQDDEVARRERDGSIDDYEWLATRAKRVHAQLHDPVSGVPLAARTIIDAVCLYDQAIPARHHADFKAVMRRIATTFRIPHEEERARVIPPPPKRSAHDQRARAAIERLDRWFSAQGAAVTGYRLLGMVNDTGVGIEGYGLAGANPLRHRVLVSRGKALVAQINALLDKLATAKGWSLK